MTTDDDLMACPHCGAPAHTIFKPPDGIEIRCTECSARAVSVDSRGFAAADWNRRPMIRMMRAAE